MRIGISADSTCDLPSEFIEKYDVRLNAMPFSLGENDLRHDGVTGTSKDVFEYVEKTGQLPTTSAYNEYEYTEHFKKVLKDYDAVIHISFSWEISSTGLNARHAAEKMENVYTVDSGNLSCGFALVVIECAKLVNEGKTIPEILSALEEMKKHIQTSFLVDTLRYLYKGGRCSGLALIGSKILSIKPRISVIDEKMQVSKKYLGNIDSCLVRYIDDIIKEKEPDTSIAFIVYSTRIKSVDVVHKKFEQAGFKQIIEQQAGPSISIHCGPGTVGVIYKEK